MVVTSKTHNHGDVMNIDRVDLTRKLDAINTWVEDVLYLNHDVLFFEGGNSSQFYVDSNRTLYLTEDDGYEENGVPSRLYKKIQAAFKWALDNKDFDYVYVCDDDVYINSEEFFKIEMNYDFMSSGAFGGGGYFLSKKAMQEIIDTDTEFSVCDLAMYGILRADKNLTSYSENCKHAIFYFPAELYATVHYATGKRAYFLKEMFSFYKENGFTNRKIILGGPLDSYKENLLVSYEATHNRKTKRWYDFVKDPNGWEYHGGYARSSANINHLKNFWPYAKNSTKYFVLNFDTFLNDYKHDKTLYFENMQFLIKKCEESLIDDNNLILLTDKNIEIDGWKLSQEVKEKLKLNFEVLNDCFFYVKKDINE